MRMAEEKRARHAKKIAAIEKKHPVFGLGQVKNEEVLRKMEKLGIQVANEQEEGKLSNH